MPEENGPIEPQEPEAYQPVDLNTHDVQLRVGQWCDAAFERHGQGERFSFMLTVKVNPPMSPEQPPSFFPAVIFWLPGAALGTVMSGVFEITNPIAITREDVDQTIRAAVEQILAARSSDLNKMTNGHGSVPPLRLAP